MLLFYEMKIHTIEAIPIAMITFTIGEMQRDSGEMLLIEKNGEEKSFSTPVTRHVAKKLRVGDKVTVICVPDHLLQHATDTLALTKHKDTRSSQTVFDRNNYLKDRILDFLSTKES